MNQHQKSKNCNIRKMQHELSILNQQFVLHPVSCDFGSTQQSQSDQCIINKHIKHLISLDREISTIFTQPHINLYTKHLHWISGTSTDTTRPKKGCWIFQVTSAPTSSWPKSLTTCMKIHNKRVEFQNHWTCFLNKLVSYTNKYVSLFASRFFLFDSFEAESVWFAWSMQVLL